MMNKKRLAAMAMSAVMIANTVPSMAFAADFGDGSAPVAQEQSVEDAVVVEEAKDVSQGYVLDPDSVLFHDDFRVTFERENPDGDRQAGTATATTLKETPATCEEPAYRWMQVVIDGQTFTSGDTNNKDEAFVIGNPLGHNYVEVKRQTITAATHFEEGLAHAWYECTNDRTHKYDDDVILDVQEHTWGEYVYVAGENVKADANGHVIFGEDDIPELIDELKDGLYYKVRYCTKDNAEDTATKQELRVYAKKASYAVIIDQGGIVNDLEGTRFASPTVDLPLNEANLELEDCSKAGWYTVEYYTEEDKPISVEKIVVEPHHYHTFVTAEFKSQDDMDQCIVKYNQDGSLNITNKSCYLPIDYTEVTHCSAAGCPAEDHKAEFEAPNDCEGKSVIKTENKTAEPAGDHVIKTSAKNAIATLVKRGNVLYSELEAIANVKENFVTISARPENNCEEGGSVTVSYICVVDKETVVETQTVDVIPTGHTRDIPTRENYVAPTCTSVGSYDAVVRCKTCNKELERRVAVKIPRIAHTNEVSVDVNGVGINDVENDKNAYINIIGDKVVDWDGESLKLVGAKLDRNWIGGAVNDGNFKHEFAITSEVLTNCTVCNDHEVVLADKLQDNISITVLDVEKQKESGEAGSITLKVAYEDTLGKEIAEEITVPYFTSIEAYQGRVESAPLNGLHKDDDGVYRYYVDDVFQKDYTGVLDYAGGKFFVTNGVLASEADGLNMFDGKWYFLSNGQVQTQHTGLAQYDGQWFYISNGKLDTTVRGLVPYNGGMFVFAQGRLVREASGLWQDVSDGTWYFLALGQVQTQHTGVAMYDNAFFYVQNGKLATDYEGTVEYDGATFKVVEGQLYGPIK